MTVERVRMLSTVKCGDQVWRKGELVSPVPPDLLKEVNDNTGTVEVLPGLPKTEPIKTSSPGDENPKATRGRKSTSKTEKTTKKTTEKTGGSADEEI